jgi:predicted metal-binding protein
MSWGTKQRPTCCDCGSDKELSEFHTLTASHKLYICSTCRADRQDRQQDLRRNELKQQLKNKH